MVNVLFDTSILIAAFVKVHPKHAPYSEWWQKATREEIDGIICTRTLGELYSVLTRLPIRPQISPTLAQQLIQENLKTFEVIPLTSEDYQIAIAQMIELNLTGGGIYDALIARVADKIEIDRILTLNPNHFTRLSEAIARRVSVPE
ncbi:MAG: type II toxin-antitoxin system VapC family toxin [Spirulina sp.]